MPDRPQGAEAKTGQERCKLLQQTRECITPPTELFPGSCDDAHDLNPKQSSELEPIDQRARCGDLSANQDIEPGGHGKQAGRSEKRNQIPSATDPPHRDPAEQGADLTPTVDQRRSRDGG
jgi:hypothetical protein